jgi:hypothetical protein
MNIIENLRKEAIKNIFRMRTFNSSFSSWRLLINENIGESPNWSKILDLGDKLSEIFKSTSQSGRSQSSVSSGGSAWEGLVCWYMNLCLIGSRTVVIKHSKELIPECVADSITVNYGSFVSNTESDLIAITFPDETDFIGDISELWGDQNFNFKNKINSLCKANFENLGIGIIQCKTNWNDNAQIPMLWDIVYSSKEFENRNISIGKNGFSIINLNKFTYSFVTVPTGRGPYTPNSVAIKRVHTLSGGNYWGKPGVSGVCNSIKEIFNRNFSAGWNIRSQRNDINISLENFENNFSYFKLSE